MLSPKELVQKVTGSTENKKTRAFSLKTKSTVNGAFFGGGLGLMISYSKKRNLYVGALLGALLGAFISNILTIEKK